MTLIEQTTCRWQVLTVAFHESGHALAGLATCAHITSVEIDPELGGLTQMRGGIQWITLPAGTGAASKLVLNLAAYMPVLSSGCNRRRSPALMARDDRVPSQGIWAAP